MTVLQWEKISADDPFVKRMRRELRMHRREKGRGGHEFMHDDIRAMWLSGDDCVIVSHSTDRVWQFWWRHPEQSWALQSWHRLLAEAKAEADKPRIVSPPPQRGCDPGLYVCAEWLKPYHGHGAMRVRCSSDYTASEISQVFQGLGCHTYTKTVV